MDIADVEGAYFHYLNTQRTLEGALKSLAEFDVNPRFEAHPSREKVHAFMNSLPKQQALAAYKSVLAKEESLAPAEEQIAPKKEGPAPTVAIKKRRKVVIPGRT